MAPTGSISSLTASVRALGERFLTLVALEGKQAGLSLAWMLGLALAAAVLAITGWLALLACVVVALVQNDIVGWPQVVKTVQVLLPLLLALNSATRAARRPRADIGGTTR